MSGIHICCSFFSQLQQSVGSILVKFYFDDDDGGHRKTIKENANLIAFNTFVGQSKY